VTAGFLLALALAAAPAARPVPELTVSVGGGPEEPAYLPVHVAAALGAFAAEGVRVGLQQAKHPTAAVGELQAGEAGVAVATLDQALRRGAARGTPVRIVLAHTRAPAVALLVSARHRAAVRTVDDLRGRRVGTAGPGTTGAIVLAALLRARRIEPWHLDLVSRGGPGLVARLASGELAAAVVEDPWATRALAAGGAEVLLDLRRPEEAARQLGGPFYEVVSVTPAEDKALAEREPALAAYARAVMRAQAWLARTPAAEVVARLPAALVTDPEGLAARLDARRDAYAPGGEAGRAGLAATLAVLRAGTPWPAGMKVTPETLREPAAVTRARAQLGPTPPAP
jgi:NitT/TauT family transport system substrate-binding protein